ncbi:hypothetical protein DFA_10559 [Cavenderia fasciculata]|uniref:Uncharacterized protein n=1 Tax=Cavenderia fasciculata TaxID=261658 RepID=F4QAJ8_CACFS|nr:uncharacterized protein DFA_10559 [Cavenderia fasciculata]EGG15717.1 hypothetical protein DFA_10559 [Cavenderia fasciculata]|eukprot:XP_004354459.1 hypothetical protein DFA_10559 [Cavenderia fasciculata]
MILTRISIAGRGDDIKKIINIDGEEIKRLEREEDGKEFLRIQVHKPKESDKDVERRLYVT